MLEGGATSLWSLTCVVALDVGGGAVVELDLCCSTGCWREGQSVELDLCCSTGWLEGGATSLWN